MHVWLKWLCRLVQCSRFFLVRDQKYLSLIKMGEQGKTLSSLFTDELHLVAHPVGMVDAFEAQFEAQPEEVIVLDWGTSYKKQEGYIVIEWDGDVDEAFIDQLTAESDIVDFSIFSTLCPSEDPLYALTVTQEGAILQ